MPWFDFVWSDAIIDHLNQHDVTPEEFEYVVCNPVAVERSDSSGRPLVKGYTEAGRRIVCVYELEDDGITVIPVTAYEPSRE